MKTYDTFARRLQELQRNSRAVRITSPGFMPLTLEELSLTAEGNRQISLTHYGKQNGDLMRDPEMIFEIHDLGAAGSMAEPIYFRNDYIALEQFVYKVDDEGRKTHVRPVLKQELRSFARTWFRSLRTQGFFDRDAHREVLS